MFTIPFIYPMDPELLTTRGCYATAEEAIKDLPSATQEMLDCCGGSAIEKMLLPCSIGVLDEDTHKLVYVTTVRKMHAKWMRQTVEERKARKAHWAKMEALSKQRSEARKRRLAAAAAKGA